MKAKTRHFLIIDFGGRGGLNVPFNLSKIVAPQYLYSKFTWRDSPYDLRDSENKLNVPLPRTNYKDYQPFLLVSTEKNVLWLIPDSVRQSEWKSLFVTIGNNSSDF